MTVVISEIRVEASSIRDMASIASLTMVPPVRAMELASSESETDSREDWADVLTEGGEFLGRGSALLQRRRLLLGAHRQVLRAGIDLLRGADNELRRRLDGRDHVLQPHHGGVEIIADQRVFLRNVFGDPEGQVAAGKRGQSFADGGYGLVALARLGLFDRTRFGLNLEAGGFRCLEIDRDGVVHVEQGGLDDGRNLARTLACARALPAEGVSGPARFQHAGDQFLQDQGIAANIPAWLQPDPGMDLADGGDGIDIGLVECAIRHSLPVALLSLLCAFDMLLAGEEAACLREGPGLAVKRLERAWQRPDDHLLDVAHALLRGCIELDEAEASGEVIGRVHLNIPNGDVLPIFRSDQAVLLVNSLSPGRLI
ncbi:hypothetical protein J2Y55_000448 [Bosea sp. BE125]|nr:hypothetical protein [Bosea sp. BE125]MDR6869455.1 hypothetical protein [Bosea sp. BE125]